VCTVLLCHPTDAANTIQARTQWPTPTVGQRDFPGNFVFTDKRAVPARLWIIATPAIGPAEAMEFFSGQRVNQVDVGSDGRSFTFRDAHGYDYRSVPARASGLEVGRPNLVAEWQADDAAHDIVMGAVLQHQATGIHRSAALPPDTVAFAAAYLGGQATCEAEVYVVEAVGSSFRQVEDGFVPLRKVFADFDRAGACWTTKPIQVIDLHDNTFIFLTRDRAFRISSKDLAPTGSAPDLKIIGFKE
jgi:hypothetical protein